MSKCLDCGACCRVFGIYELDKWDLLNVPEYLITRCHLYPSGGRMQTNGFKCSALACGNECSIYNQRPKVCRLFEEDSDLCKMAIEQDKILGKVI